MEPAANAPAQCAVHPEVPAARPCEHCGTFACEPCLELFEDRWICQECLSLGRVRATAVPWARRDELGWVRAYLLTLWAMIRRPTVFFEQLRVERPMSDVIWFYLPTALVEPVAGALLAWDGPWYLLEDALLPVASDLVLAGIAHVSLSILASAHGGWRGTLRVVLYTGSLATLLTLPSWSDLPFTLVVPSLWIIWLRIVGLAAQHGCSRWRVFGSLTFGVLLAAVSATILATRSPAVLEFIERYSF